MGLLCALAALTKPFMLVYPAVALAMWWMQGRELRGVLIRTAMMTGVMLLVIAPWTVRNYQAFGRFILISYNMGYNQIINNNYGNTHGGWMPLGAVPMPQELQNQIEESLRYGRGIQEAYELEPLLGAHARHWMVRNPVAVAQLGLLRVQRTFFNGAGDISQWAMNDWDFYERYEERGTSPVRSQRHLHFFEGLFSIIVNVFSAAGLLFVLMTVLPYVRDFFFGSRDLSIAEGMAFIHIAFFVVITAAFEGQERYAHPVFIFFIFAVIWLCTRRGGHRNNHVEFDAI
jgi:4-amino-4-deoxy-L-arabinose transferase-like glycosyltransferase